MRGSLALPWPCWSLQTEVPAVALSPGREGRGRNTGQECAKDASPHHRSGSGTSTLTQATQPLPPSAQLHEVAGYKLVTSKLRRVPRALGCPLFRVPERRVVMRAGGWSRQMPGSGSRTALLNYAGGAWCGGWALR